MLVHGDRVITRRSISLAVGIVLAAPLAIDAQPKEKVWRIGYIGISPAGASPESERIMDVFLQELSASGFVVGKNAVLERRALEVGAIEPRRWSPS